MPLDDQPLASFIQTRQPWVRGARCLREGVDPAVFYDEERVGDARAVCARCPVRSQCATQALVEEGSSAVELRSGIRGYLTPAQRSTIAKRGGLAGVDPLALATGWDGERRIPSIPDDGDQWSRHHTTLARKVVRWLVDNVDVGATLPTQASMCKALSCHPTPLRRVMEALVQDGTLDFAGTRTGKQANGATVRYVRRKTPRRVASWLPPHLRTN